MNQQHWDNVPRMWANPFGTSNFYFVENPPGKVRRSDAATLNPHTMHNIDDSFLDHCHPAEPHIIDEQP